MNWNQGRFPSLHHRKEGWLRHQENVAQQPKPTQPGWFSFCFQSENHPVRANAEASRYFLDRTATPPCGDARRGVSLDSNSFTPSMTATAQFLCRSPNRHRVSVHEQTQKEEKH